MLGVVVDMSAVHAEPLDPPARRRAAVRLLPRRVGLLVGRRRSPARRDQLGLPRSRRQGRRRELRRPALTRLPGAQLLGLRPDRQVLEADLGGQRGQLPRLRRQLRERRHGAAAKGRSSTALPRSSACAGRTSSASRSTGPGSAPTTAARPGRPSGRSSTAVSYSWVDPHFAALYARREEERLAERLVSRLARARRLRAEPRTLARREPGLDRAGNHPARQPPAVSSRTSLGRRSSS